MIEEDGDGDAIDTVVRWLMVRLVMVDGDGGSMAAVKTLQAIYTLAH